ncbi:minor capsid protein [Agrobacterium sp. CG674]
MIFDILGKKLAAAGLVTTGESLFFNDMPGECVVGVMMRTPLQGIDIDPFIEGWHKTPLQIITRHTDPVDGEALANAVCKALIVESPERYEATDERGPAHINVFYPQTYPIRFPRLEGNGLEWSQHFTTAFGIVPAWKQ